MPRSWKKISGSAEATKNLFKSDSAGALLNNGTLFSKVYKVIERFSEDAGIVLDCDALGFTGSGLSQRRRHNRGEPSRDE
jgi:hypothetical protein